MLHLNLLVRSVPLTLSLSLSLSLSNTHPALVYSLFSPLRYGSSFLTRHTDSQRTSLHFRKRWAGRLLVIMQIIFMIWPGSGCTGSPRDISAPPLQDQSGGQTSHVYGEGRLVVMFEGAWKLFQRKLYSWLSSKCGLPICIVGLLLAVISAFQFGEVSANQIK